MWTQDHPGLPPLQGGRFLSTNNSSIRTMTTFLDLFSDTTTTYGTTGTHKLA